MSVLNGKIIEETRRKNPFVHQIEIYNSVEKIKVSFCFGCMMEDEMKVFEMSLKKKNIFLYLWPVTSV